MLRIVRVSTLVLIVLAIWVQPARADAWDWLDDLSGPGSFHSRGNLAATIHCEGAGWFKQNKFDPEKRTCYFADVRRFKNKDDSRFFDSRMEIYEAGPMIRLAPSLDVGVGLGVIHIDSSGRKLTRMTMSFPRVVFKPLLVQKWKGHDPDPDLGFFQIYFRENRLFGSFTEATFNPKPGTTFSAKGDLVKSVGFIVDLPLATHGLTRLIRKIH